MAVVVIVTEKGYSSTIFSASVFNTLEETLEFVEKVNKDKKFEVATYPLSHPKEVLEAIEEEE